LGDTVPSFGGAVLACAGRRFSDPPPPTSLRVIHRISPYDLQVAVDALTITLVVECFLSFTRDES